MSTAVATAAGGDDQPRRSPAGAAKSPAEVVRHSGLPPLLAQLVLSVTGNCRLWNSERIDVARELCAHFQDGLDAGVPAQDLSLSFGGPRRAAKLITAGRKRMRPVWWRAGHATLLAVGAFVLLLGIVYAVLAARFFLASPNIARNYSQELNAAVRATPQADRAWPLYLDAKVQFGALPEFVLSDEARGPGDARWPEMAAWLDSHTDAFATLRTAAGRPVLGVEYRSRMDPALGRAMELTNPGYQYAAEMEHEPDNPLLVGVLLPHLGEMRRNARLLRSDAALAAEQNDRARLLADIDALLAMGNQALRERFAISQLSGLAVCKMAATLVLEHLSRAELLSDHDLRDLAHKLAAVGGGRISIDTTTEVLAIEDILQRFYSDDGNGDGRFIGGPEAQRLMTEFGGASPEMRFSTSTAFAPVRSVLLPSRAELLAKAKLFGAVAAADDALPPWRHDERSADKVYLDLMRSGVYAAVPFLESLHQSGDEGPIAAMLASRDIFVTKRDAALVALALESFRRSHGEWPSSLDELVPAYLPSVPLDPFDGKPLRYIPAPSAADKPVIYSIGADAIDDAGTPPATAGGRFSVHSLRLFAKASQGAATAPEEQQRLNNARGDWVLWPPLPPLPDEPTR